MATINFNASEVEPSQEFQPLPEGKYEAVISDSDVKSTRNGSGRYVQLEFEVVSGEHKGRRVWGRYNIENPAASADPCRRVPRSHEKAQTEAPPEGEHPPRRKTERNAAAAAAAAQDGAEGMQVTLALPWPPSVNHYYRHVGPRVFISKDGRRFREAVKAVARRAGCPRLEGPVTMKGRFHPPDRRRRDLDNVGGKAFIDALQCAGLFTDDCQIKRISLEMLEPVENGLCVIELENIDNGES